MDEVIADALGEHLFRYNRDFPPTPADAHFPEPLTAAHLAGRRLWQAVPESRHATLDSYLEADDFFRNLPVMPDAARVLESLQSRYDIFIASAAMEIPSSFTAKFNWLAEHFPFIPSSHIVFCGDKGIIRTDFLIDDNPRQLRAFHGEGILFSSPSNVNVTGFRRVHTWLDVEHLFLD
jgi:5'(3')-deoxyribonucleotidase